MTIMIPRINLNGTDGNVLLQENMDALAAVSNAINYLERVTVHGRDYQTHEFNNAILTAMREHSERLTALRKIEHNLAEIAVGIQEQLRERAR